MTMRDLLDELDKIAEMQSMVKALAESSPTGKPRSGHLLTVAIQRAQSRLREHYSSSQLEAAMRTRLMLADEAA